MSDGFDVFEDVKAGDSPRPVGRPTDYRPEFARIARAMCKLGATNYELAQEFGVSRDTINQWQVKHSEFSDSLKIGKGEYDDRIKRSLAERAMGYTYDADEVHVNKDGDITRYTRKVHVPPDTRAAQTWLSARNAKEWAEAKKLEVSGKVEVTPTLPAEELARRLVLILDEREQQLAATSKELQVIDVNDD